MTFEIEYEFDKTKVPILVVDLRVSVFSLLWRAKKYEEVFTDEDLKLLWQQRLNYPLMNFPNQRFQLVVVDDTKYVDGTYWRTRFLDNDWLINDRAEKWPKYKGNRKPEERPELYYRLHEAGVAYAKENGIPYFAKKGFEADDFAGAICGEAKNRDDFDRPLILYTVDSDWGQLVNDNKQIMFYYCNFPVWKDKLRDEQIIIQWFEERQNITLLDVEDIVDAKVSFGDKSDNLEPGSPRGVIDLKNPSVPLPAKYHRQIRKVLSEPSFNSHPLKYDKATNDLNRKIYEFIQHNKT